LHLIFTTMMNDRASITISQQQMNVTHVWLLGACVVSCELHFNV